MTPTDAQKKKREKAVLVRDRIPVCDTCGDESWLCYRVKGKMMCRKCRAFYWRRHL